ncbi:MAG: toprim domain-containing protein [Eubacteriales bacterium]|nr:toprim domain-containing protein [Eubacteriales bacterium]
MAKKQEYNEQSISSLKGADRVRKRPAVIFGSDGLEGCEHSFFEILSNAIDEYREGYGKQINITVYNDKSMTVEDFGRGVPLDWNEKEGRFNWELVYCELYAGGKYQNSSGGAYEYSLGLNGLGACATQYSSEYMEVSACTRGTKFSVSFKKGEAVTGLIKEPCAKTKTGTTIHWKPDLDVFTDIDIPKEYFHTVLKKQAVVNEGLLLCLSRQNADGSFEKTEFIYPKGIVDYIYETVGVNYLNEPVFYSAERSGRDREDKDEYKLRIGFAFCFSNEVQMIEYYHNSSFLEHGGSPEKALKSAFTGVIDKYLKSNGKYKAKESKITFSDIEDCLVFVSNSSSTQASYANQTKKAINNAFIAEAMTEFFKHCLEVYFLENPQSAERICGQILINKRSREQSESMRINVKKQLTSSLDVSNNVDKFVNCRSKDKNKCELYIVEGDSALTSCKLARNAEFQAIIPVRGKTLNCLKATFDKILSNDIITDLIKVIGCGIEMGGKSKASKSNQIYNRDALRWNKIIICTDADEDGYQIRTLILTMLFRLLPSLIREGLVYIAQTPLYEITSKNETYFAYDEKEKAEVLSKLGNVKYTLQRSKGLGENDADMMSRTTMTPATRRLLQIKLEDEAKTYEMFDILLGDNITMRKEFISLYGAKYLPMADI